MELKDTAIFILTLNRFDSNLQSTSYNIAKEFAKHNQVYLIDNPFTLKDYFTLKKTEQYNQRKDSFFKKEGKLLDTAIKNLKIIIPPLTLSVNFIPEGKIYRFIQKFNEKIVLKCLQSHIKQKSIKKVIFINSFNFHYAELGSLLKPQLYIYNCIDPIRVEYDMKHGFKSEYRIVKTCNLVICTSKQLYREKIKINPHTYFIPNAADIYHFNNITHHTTKEIKNLIDIKGPVIGYLGNIERRIDYNLLKNLALLNKNKTFLLVGPIEKEEVPDFIYDVSNIIFFGWVPYDQVPYIIRKFDVAIIPFKSDEVSATIFPLKLFEYLGVGKPVVCSNFNPDLEPFTKGIVKYCNDAKTFSHAIQDELANNNKEKVNQRILIAAENTWESRIKDVYKIIHHHLQK
jgi:glycosyltransferase involved in cell wall biosynthesis